MKFKILFAICLVILIKRTTSDLAEDEKFSIYPPFCNLLFCKILINIRLKELKFLRVILL